MKVEIEFDQDFERNAILPIPLGRLQVGNHIARLFFTPEGKMVMYVDGEAVKDGSVVIGKIFPEVSGFMPERKKDEGNSGRV